MKVLYLECKMGCAGDMLMGALSELVDKEEFIKEINNIGLPDVKVIQNDSFKCGIKGTHITVSINGAEEESNDVNNTAMFCLSVQNCNSHQIEHILDHIEQIKDISEVKYENNELSFVCLHDLGEHIQEEIKTIILDHYPQTIINSMGHTHNAHKEHHNQNTMINIKEIINNLKVSENVKKHAIAVYELIAQAESSVHGMTVDNIHFHEVGTIDAVVDIVGTCMLMEKIKAQRVYVSPIALGNGMVKCAHGILPVPAPAVAYILNDVPTYSGNMQGELCTPTGAALLKHFADSFQTQPTIKTKVIGYGMGKKNFAAANCVRAFLGDMKEDGQVCELTCNLDDITGEQLGFAFDQLFANGALDVYVTPVVMKKNRPGYVFVCMCKTDDKEKMIELMFKHLTTLGIRETSCVRHALSRSVTTKQTKYGAVRIKTSSGYNIIREKIEYEDLAKIAKENNLSIDIVRKEIEEEI